MPSRMTIDDIVYWFTRDRIPFTKAVVAASILAFLVNLFDRTGVFRAFSSFDPSMFILKPWSIFTYPLVQLDALSLLFAGYWMWVAGGSLERTWRTRTFAVFFLGMSAISALGIWLGYMATGKPVSLSGLWAPLAAVTVAFGMQNPEQVILFMLIIPMKLKYLAAISAGLLFVGFSRMHFLLGLFSLTGCAAAYWYVRYGYDINLGLRTAYRDNVVRINPSRSRRKGLLGWYRDWRERKRLRDFLNK